MGQKTTDRLNQTYERSRKLRLLFIATLGYLETPKT